jgi:hypothetical protein
MLQWKCTYYNIVFFISLHFLLCSRLFVSASRILKDPSLLTTSSIMKASSSSCNPLILMSNSYWVLSFSHCHWSKKIPECTSVSKSSVICWISRYTWNGKHTTILFPSVALSPRYWCITHTSHRTCIRCWPSTVLGYALEYNQPWKGCSLWLCIFFLTLYDIIKCESRWN